MAHAGRRSGSRRLAALALAVCLLLPVAGQAQTEGGRWYDDVVRGANLTFDVLALRTSSAITLAAGTALFVPVAILTSPGGRDTIEEAWEYFVIVPGSKLWERPLGEF